MADHFGTGIADNRSVYRLGDGWKNQCQCVRCSRFDPDSDLAAFRFILCSRRWVSGSGTTTISANATNNGGISQKVNVSSGVTLTNNAALGSDSGTITNAGTITSDASNIKGSVTNNNTLNLSGGTLSKVVSGSGTTLRVM